MFEEEVAWPLSTEDVDVFSGLWRGHYAGTQWAALWDAVSPEDYAKATGLAKTGDMRAAHDFLYERAPAQTNVFEGNLCVNLGGMFLDNGRGGANCTAGADIFRDYGHGDFTLTPRGLALIRQSIPGFEEIPLRQIGLMPYIVNGRLRLPGGR
ncbi:MAG: hypothetical protein VB099_09865 [Candidatus Limiplasma sp.]|nr:hypothetical protein [Candidatus Limiplasma sp.]